MAIAKLGKPTDQRVALVRNQVTSLLWYGKIETTLARAKSVQRLAEKLITLAVNSYEDIVTVEKEVKDVKGKLVKKEFVNDGVKKLNARRKIMTTVYDIQEQRADKETKANFVARTKDINHPLVEKIFNVYAPKYAQRAKEVGTGGGYTRIIKLGRRNGDNAEVVIIELI
ncbi:MAG: bL17 family ribosomal protein [Christensenellales bacterium]|jgi:large subunit ribosomal protein L17